MIRRLLLLAVPVALAVSACANDQLGQEPPVCQRDPSSIDFTTGLIIQMQAVPDAALVPCIDALPAGWDYEHVVAESGRSRFWISSDRMGENFLEVTLTPSCSPSLLADIGIFQPGVDEYRDVEMVSSSVNPVIITVTGREVDYAQVLKNLIEGESLNDRRPFVRLDTRDVPLAEKVSEAQDAGDPIIIVGEQDMLANTADLQLPGETGTRRGLGISELIDRLDDRLPAPRYEGTWTYVFQGGCITYEFDAEGPDVDTLEERDVAVALGFLDADNARQVLRDAGVMQ